MALLPYAPMRVSDFDYSLPDELIARYPAAERRGSRLLEVGAGLIDRSFAELGDLLREGDLLVFNDTRVIPARLLARKATGGRAEVLVERITGVSTALAQIRASKSPRPGSRLVFAAGVEATVDARHEDLFALSFTTELMPFLSAHGEVPLPPYLDRPPETADAERYQTVYARAPGAVAAPTAGLHFDEGMLEETRRMGVEHAYLTLHVGAGTFAPLRHEDVSANRLHLECLEVPEACCAAAERARGRGGRVIAVGTTSVRALETAAGEDGALQPFEGETELFILPGYRFRAIDAMITNFHLPRSSLLMLVAAFGGTERLLAAYAHAVRQRYRFFSYGDAMFLTPGGRS
jgi:S-adenosylmethionine:tRNA ribosyltransferase-isomerase